MSLSDALVLNVRGGGRLCLPPALNMITTYVLLEQEDWFEDEIRFVRRWLRPGMRAVDVGANYGVYTLAMARSVGRDGRVWAFEPTPDTADFLDATLRLNDLGQVALSRAAVSSHAGRVALTLESQPEGNRVASSTATGNTIEVPAVTLDQAAEGQNWEQVDFIKLDIEGHELEAISGGAGWLRSCSPLLMLEVNNSQIYDFRALDPLAEMGYQFYMLLPELMALVPFDPKEPVDDFLLNLFACKPGRAKQLAAEGFLAQTAAASQAAPTGAAWTDYARAAPYARDLAARWGSAPGIFSGADARIYLRGLGAFARSRDIRQSAAERYGWLRHAMDCMEEAAAGSSGKLACKISYARVAWEIGWRRSAVTALSDAVNRVAAESLDVLAEPFLAPSPRYERLAAGKQGSEWLLCAVSEQLEKLRAYSSMLVEVPSLSILEPISGLAFRSPEVDRRCQLVRMLEGLQTGPQPTPLLCTRSEENLNPEFWCASRAA